MITSPPRSSSRRDSPRASSTSRSQPCRLKSTHPGRGLTASVSGHCGGVPQSRPRWLNKRTGDHDAVAQQWSGGLRMLNASPVKSVYSWSDCRCHHRAACHCWRCRYPGVRPPYRACPHHGIDVSHVHGEPGSAQSAGRTYGWDAGAFAGDPNDLRRSFWGKILGIFLNWRGASGHSDCGHDTTVWRALG